MALTVTSIDTQAECDDRVELVEAFPSVWLIDPQMNWQDLDHMTVFNTIITYL